MDRRICVIGSILTHFSVRKCANILGIGEGRYQPCPECHVIAHFFHAAPDGSGLVLVPTDQYGAISLERNQDRTTSSLEQLEKTILYRINRGIRRFIIIANAGTTMTGGVDDISAIGSLIEKIERQYPNESIGFYLHVDAAFGGFVAPFLNRPLHIGFDAHPRVDSMTLDPHKMGLAPYPAGIFLCRHDERNLLNCIAREIEYVAGHRDFTICGSRSGAAVAAVWAVWKYLKHEGYSELVAQCMATTRRLADHLAEEIRKEDIIIYPPTLNLLAFGPKNAVFNAALRELDRIEKEAHQHNANVAMMTAQQRAQAISDTKLQKIAAQYVTFYERFTLPSTWLPEDLGSLESHPHRIHKCVIMPHGWVRERADETIATFVEEFKKLIELARA